MRSVSVRVIHGGPQTKVSMMDDVTAGAEMMYLEGRLTKITTASSENHQKSHYCSSIPQGFYSFSDFSLKNEYNEWESGVNDGPDGSFISTSSSHTVSLFSLLSAFCGLREAVLTLQMSGFGKIKKPPLLEGSGLTTSCYLCCMLLWGAPEVGARLRRCCEHVSCSRSQSWLSRLSVIADLCADTLFGINQAYQSDSC